MSGATRSLLFGCAAVLVAAPVLASTRVAVYAIVDEIAFEPSSFEPERAWISGVFVVPVPISSGLHQAPARGHLYLSLSPANAEATRRDWESLKANAGTGRVVGFGEYWMRCSLVRSAPELPPDAEDANCSAEITVVETDRTRATAEPYPAPSSEGVVTVFDSEDDICQRFGQSSAEIIATLREAHSPGSPRDEPAVCKERIGLVDSSDLDSAFAKQTRDDAWAHATETLILKRIADAPGLKLSDLRVECRDTICWIHAAFATREYQETTGLRLVANALKDLPGFAPGGKGIPPDREPTIDFYYQRRSPR